MTSARSRRSTSPPPIARRCRPSPPPPATSRRRSPATASATRSAPISGRTATATARRPSTSSRTPPSAPRSPGPGCAGTPRRSSTTVERPRRRGRRSPSPSTRSTARRTSTSTSRSARSSASTRPRTTADASFLRPGRELRAAGYVIYGPQTALVASFGDGRRHASCSTGRPAVFRLAAGAHRRPEVLERVRDQRLELPPLAAADPRLRRRLPRRRRGAARLRLQHPLDRLARRRGPPHRHPRRRLPLPRRPPPRLRARPPAPGLRVRADRLPDRAGRRQGHRRLRPHPRPARRPACTSARPSSSARPRRSTASPPTTTCPTPRPRRCSASAACSGRAGDEPEAPDHLGHRLVGRGHHHGQAHLRPDLPPRGHQGGVDRGRRLPPLRPRRDEGRARRAAEGGGRDLQPLQLRGQHPRGPRAGLPRVRRDRQGPDAPLRPRRPRGGGATARAPGTFSDWAAFEDDSDLLFYEGLHGAVANGDVNLSEARRPQDRRRPGHQPRVDPEDPPRPRQPRLHHRGGDRRDPAPDARLRALHLPAVHRDRHQLPAGAGGRHLEPVHRALDPDGRREPRRHPLPHARAGSTSPTSSR